MLFGPGFEDVGGTAAAAFPAADRYDANFAAGATPAGAGFTFTRASSAWNNAFTAFASGAPVLDSSGLALEEGRTNLYFPSQAPVTKSLTLATIGTYVCWVIGSGSCAVTNASTGNGTATAAAPLVFTTTTASKSVTFTVSGTLTHLAVELAAYRTLPVLTTSAAVTRVVDTCSVARSGLAAGTVALRCVCPYNHEPAGGGFQTLWRIDDGTSSNRVQLQIDQTGQLLAAFVSAGVSTQTAISAAGDITPSAALVVVLGWGAGDNRAEWSLGGTARTGVAFATAMPAATPTTERLGGGPSGLNAFNGYLPRAMLWSTRRSDAELAAIRDNI